MAARVSGVAVLPPSAGGVRKIYSVGNGEGQGQGEIQEHIQRQGEEEGLGQEPGQGTRQDRLRRGIQTWNQRPVWGGHGKGWGHPRKDKDGSPNIRSFLCQTLSSIFSDHPNSDIINTTSHFSTITLCHTTHYASYALKIQDQH